MNPYVQKYMDVVNKKGLWVWEDHHSRYLGDMTPENIAKVAHLALTDRKEINCLVWEALSEVFDVSWNTFCNYRHGTSTMANDDLVKTFLIKLATQKEPNLEEWL